MRKKARQRKIYEKAILNENTFEVIFQYLPVPMFLLDEERQISKMTLAAKEIFARQLNALRDRTFGKVINCIHSLNNPRGCGFSNHCQKCAVKRAVSNIYKTGKAYYRQEVKFRVGEKQQDRFLIISGSSLDLSFGRKVLLYCEDITERKQQEENFRKLKEELMHVSRVTTMGELTAALAHELNQPLMAIMSNTQAAQRFLAKENPDLNEIKEILSDIVKDDKRASDVITKLRALLKKSEFEFTALNINEVIQEVISLLHSDIVIKNIVLITEFAENTPSVHGDRIQLQQVILNLVLNSFDAMADVDLKRLCIQTAKEDAKFITVSVEDTGSGIDEENIGLLFKPFFTTKKEGLGMGLAINQAIIESHGGTLWVKKNPERGATFYFTVPISQ